jgi:hypothetical protein
MCILAPATRFQSRFLHIILSSIPTFINLKGGFRELDSLPLSYGVALAAGTEGSELLFQATSEEMIRAYSKVPKQIHHVLRPHFHLLMAHPDILESPSRTRSSAPEYYFPSMWALDDLSQYSGWLTWSRLARTSANSSNISTFRDLTYVVLASPFHTSPMFMFGLDSRQQSYVSHAPGMT